NWQIAHARSGRVIDCVSDSRGNADDPYLAYPFDAERIAVVRLVDKNDLDVFDVRVHRHKIFGDIGINDSTIPVIDQRFLAQRHSDTPDHATYDLARRGLGVEDAPGGNGADDARDADHAELLVHLHLSEDRRMCVVCARVLAGVGSYFPLDAVHSAVAHGIR